VLFAPGGMASLIMVNMRVLRVRMLGRMKRAYAETLAAGLLLLLAVIAVVEMSYHRLLDSDGAMTASVFGVSIDTGSGAAWLAALALLGMAGGLFRWARQRLVRQWRGLQALSELHHGGAAERTA
jgi:branched-chain amino acid transport system permease protein